MILTLSYRGMFRQEQYETVTVEGSVTADTSYELQGMGPDELVYALNTQLNELVRQKIAEAEMTCRYSEDDTTIYEWKRITDATGNTPAHGQPRRRIRRGD